MAKRESKGQKVKTFKAHIPDERGEFSAETVTVYLQVGEHMCFIAWLPQHIGNALPGLDCYGSRAYFGGGAVSFDERSSTVRSTTLDSLKEAYETALRQFAKMLTEQNVVPVLHVEFKANLPYSHERANGGDFQFHYGRATGSADISFCPSPAIALVVKKLWRQPGKTVLYHKRLERGPDREDREVLGYDSASLGNYADAAVIARWERSIIPWTPEREEFLFGIVANIEKLGWLMKDFLKDFEANITFAIENGSKSLMLALPKPAEPPAPDLTKLPKIRHRERQKS